MSYHTMRVALRSLPVRKRSMLNCSIGNVMLAPSRISSVISLVAIGACMKPCIEKEYHSILTWRVLNKHDEWGIIIYLLLQNVE